MAEQSTRQPLPDKIAWRLGARPWVTFAVVFALALAAGVFPAQWLARQGFVATLREALVPSPKPETPKPKPVKANESPPVAQPAEIPDAPPSPTAAAVPESPPAPIVAPEPQPRPLPEPVSEHLERDIAPSTPEIPAPDPQPMRKEPSRTVEKAAPPERNALPESANTATQDSAATDARNAVAAAESAASAAQARFKRENRTPTRNESFKAGEEALESARERLRAGRFPDASSFADAARRKFDLATPTPWETTPIVIKQ